MPHHFGGGTLLHGNHIIKLPDSTQVKVLPVCRRSMVIQSNRRFAEVEQFRILPIHRQSHASFKHSFDLLQKAVRPRPSENHETEHAPYEAQHPVVRYAHLQRTPRFATRLRPGGYPRSLRSSGSRSVGGGYPSRFVESRPRQSFVAARAPVLFNKDVAAAVPVGRLYGDCRTDRSA